ncbi:MAG: polysaccharide deacetylase family protein, partial [Flavobacteriales bacterium]
FNYEHRLESNVDRILELLDRKNQKATFFILGWVAREFPQVVKKIQSHGYEIATHSDLHQIAYEQNKSEFKNDIEKSIKSIEDLTGQKIKSYRAPGFSITQKNLWVFDELIKQGIEFDCSVFPASRSHGGLEQYGYANPSIIECSEGNIKEFPINLYPIFGRPLIFSGGGYFRLFPYGMIKKMMNNSKYVMTYFHPRDFDPKQPMINELSLTRKFKSYYGLNGAFNKLERLISDYKFIDLRKADEEVNWDKAKKITVNSL